MPIRARSDLSYKKSVPSARNPLQFQGGGEGVRPPILNPVSAPEVSPPPNKILRTPLPPPPPPAHVNGTVSDYAACMVTKSMISFLALSVLRFGLKNNVNLRHGIGGACCGAHYIAS